MTFQNLYLSHPLHRIVEVYWRLRSEIAENRRTRAVYNQTFAELSAMSDRELVDIGLSRGDIGQISAEAANM
ncbi:DUF1127 domain-containing protein [Actibacterium sp. 188UL27-1]|uniref:DUF1127 domain-containing protein n=1 Tax=Actibacterium sp. 188UL27-1 TaxID=2786961 RepID=UPI00195784E9|nr:DUF1127 domain-containing protein [Actibacterium sp. 188UL27-1]MBM7070063.1 DUF1127 domain-containing protein [Actibacterium sp. 188UL27-1]